MASTILRFVYPDEYCCVDWRNWLVLSYQRHPRTGKTNQLFDSPPLNQLLNPFSSNTIRSQDYVRYLSVIRDLARNAPRAESEKSLDILSVLFRHYGERTPAEIDMAIFSYSWDFHPRGSERT